MIVNLTTLNVRGLNDPKKTTRLKNYIKSIQPIIEVFLI
jgi:hypothetical protein